MAAARPKVEPQDGEASIVTREHAAETARNPVPNRWVVQAVDGRLIAGAIEDMRRLDR